MTRAGREPSGPESAADADPRRTLVQIRSDMRWQKVCFALTVAGSPFGYSTAPERPADLSAQWAAHLRDKRYWP